MKKRKNIWIVSLLLCFLAIFYFLYLSLGIECESPYGPSESKEVGASMGTSYSSSEITPLDDFSELRPEAEIYQYLLCDMDNNGEDDYVILFTEKDVIPTCTAGLAVFLTDSLYSAIDLAAETDFVFDSKASVAYNCGIPVISLELRDTKNSAKYLYSVEFTINDEMKEANYKIASKPVD